MSHEHHHQSPDQIDLEKINLAKMKVNGVKGVEHVHVWAMSTTNISMTAHITVDENLTIVGTENIKDQLSHVLEQLNIHYVTLEIECNQSRNSNNQN